MTETLLHKPSAVCTALRGCLRHFLVWLQAATDVVKGLQNDADKAKATSERLQQMVASLTADNLMFVMRLKKSERELQAASEERDELRLEVDQQRGPWLDEVSRHAVCVSAASSANETSAC